MSNRYKSITLICITINLIIGNLALVMFLDLTIIHRLIISVSIIFIYGFTFENLRQTIHQQTKWKLTAISILLSLIGMMIACIVTSISIRLPSDSIITAGLKGIIPLYIFALVLASPLWIVLAIVNFFCLNFIKKQ